MCNVYIYIYIYFSEEINNSSNLVGKNGCRLVLCDNKYAKIISESEMSMATDAIGYLAEVEILRSVSAMM